MTSFEVPEYDFVIDCGSDWSKVVTVTDANGVLINWSNWTGLMQARTDPGGDLIINFSVVISGTTITIGLLGSASLGLLSQCGDHQLRMTMGSQSTILFTGTVEFKPVVSI